MPAHTGSGSIALRGAVETMLRQRLTTSRLVADFATDAHGAMIRTAQAVAPVNSPLSRRIAHVALQWNYAIYDILAPITDVIDEEAHALLAALAETHGAGPIGPLQPSLDRHRQHNSPSTIANVFPPGFARAYAHDLLTDLSRKAYALSKRQAGAVAIVGGKRLDDATYLVVEQFEGMRRAVVGSWLLDPRSHAMTNHSDCVGDDALLARLVWRRPPDGVAPWTLDESGRIATKHRAGTVTGRFNSPAAMAKPLRAYLDVAEKYPGGHLGLLERYSTGWSAIFFVSAETAGLVRGDTTAYRGVGTATAAGAKDWRRRRTRAMEANTTAGPPVHAVRYDPVADGSDPGAQLTFVKDDDGTWHLLSVAPNHDRAVTATRLEDVS